MKWEFALMDLKYRTERVRRAKIWYVNGGNDEMVKMRESLFHIYMNTESSKPGGRGAAAGGMALPPFCQAKSIVVLDSN